MRNKLSEQCLQPLWDYAILERDDDLGARIIRPENADPTKIGTLELVVLFTGPDCRNIKPGDKLIFNPQAVVLIAYEGRTYYLISERATGAVVSFPRQMKLSQDGRMPL